MFVLSKIGTISFFIALLFMQCSTPNSAVLVDNWSAEDYDTPGFQNILVVGIARRPEVRTSFEYELKSQLKSKKVKVVASSDVMPPDEKIDSETFHKYFDDKNIDAVITTQLIAVDELPSNANSGKSQHLDAASFYEYYDSNYGSHAEEEMDKQNLILKVETNVYETKEEQKVWSGTSKAFQQGRTANILGDLAKEIAKTIKEEGLIKH